MKKFFSINFVEMVVALGMLVFIICISCAALKSTLRTIDDVATDLCMIVATEQDPKDLQGMSPSQWCAIHDNLKPFIDAALSAKADAAGRSGFGQ